MGDGRTICQTRRLRGQLTFEKYPPLQAPETFNLTGILDQMKKASHPSE